MSGIQILGTTVGPVQENSFLVWKEGAGKAVMIDPGDEADRLMEPLAERGLELEAILLTHCHFDHIGAVAPVAAATGAPVWCPEIEVGVLADIMAYVPWPGIGPYESYDADHTVSGGEHLSLAGLEFDVLFTPGHSPGHVSYSLPAAAALFSGDVRLPELGRPGRPAGRGLGHPARVDQAAGRQPPSRDRGLSRAHGRDHALGRAGEQPVPG